MTDLPMAKAKTGNFKIAAALLGMLFTMLGVALSYLLPALLIKGEIYVSLPSSPLFLWFYIWMSFGFIMTGLDLLGIPISKCALPFARWKKCQSCERKIKTCHLPDNGPCPAHPEGLIVPVKIHHKEQDADGSVIRQKTRQDEIVFCSSECEDAFFYAKFPSED